ncbi:MAG TPA: DUF177 domain-containing protein [Cyclobacteriaceae bacterium]|nr:DUF177 domain-containing protein [Cyclobacteriaceae bacterium]
MINRLSEFGINIQSLDDREYFFEYRIDEGFFTNFENSAVNKGRLNCRATVNKTSSFIRVTFHIAGSIELICDRSLDPFQFPVDLTGQTVYKFGDQDHEMDDEVIMIPRTKREINLSQNIYELIAMAIPMKKLHPRYDQEISGEDEIIYTTGGTTGKDKSPVMDPRWEALKKLKGNK